MDARVRVALTLARGAVALVLIIACGAYSRVIIMTLLYGKDVQISENAVQLITALGSALVGGAVGYISGISSVGGGQK